MHSTVSTPAGECCERHPECVPSEDVSVTIQDNVLTFSDSALRNFSIGFDPHPDGSFGLISTAISGGSVLIQGRIVGNVLDADVTSGPCEHHWHERTTRTFVTTHYGPDGRAALWFRDRRELDGR
jgi:hypothetical protein